MASRESCFFKSSVSTGLVSVWQGELLGFSVCRFFVCHVRLAAAPGGGGNDRGVWEELTQLGEGVAVLFAQGVLGISCGLHPIALRSTLIWDTHRPLDGRSPRGLGGLLLRLPEKGLVGVNPALVLVLGQAVGGWRRLLHLVKLVVGHLWLSIGVLHGGLTISEKTY